jgi:formylglycine-generating enzyme required for sulfatase activity
MTAITLDLAAERLRLIEGVPPEWASEWGQDRFGLFLGFTVGDATQLLRWIPPGEFVMGSPETEAGRYPNESPQHTVTITHGFWLFETPCTQAPTATTARSHSRKQMQVYEISLTSAYVLGPKGPLLQ